MTLSVNPAQPDVFTMHAELQDAIEEVCDDRAIAPATAAFPDQEVTVYPQVTSSRSTAEKRAEALAALERMLGAACCASEDAANTFLALQDTFECNVPSRLLPWIAAATPSLESLLKGLGDKEPSPEAVVLSEQLHQALSLIQGVALIHPPSKRFLGRPHALQILIHLLLVSRHLSSDSPKTSETSSRPASNIYLCATVLDTLLCVLVDSPPALRVFEDVGGIQVAVRLLKRAGTPRQVRMKSLEFLYFYLIDESSGDLPLAGVSERSAPSSPRLDSKPLEPSLPTRSHTFSTLSSHNPAQPSIKSSQPSYAHKPSKSDVSSMSTTPVSASATPAVMVTSPSITSVVTSPPATPRPAFLSHPPPSTSSRTGTRHARSHSLVSTASSRRSSTSSTSGRSTAATESSSANVSPASSVESIGSTAAKPKSLLLLQREIEYTPLSPARPLGGKPGINGSTPRLPGTPVRNSSTPTSPCTPGGHTPIRTPLGSSVTYNRVRSTEEKKAILGDMLGNVDQLVEGVRKAGIWGL